MSNPVIIYDATNGSDTAASGSNAPTTAVTGTNGDVTGSGTTLTLNETKDFTGALDDGNDVLWLNGNAGDRHLFTISSFTGGVSSCTAVVVDQAFDNTVSGTSWAVGGERKTLDNLSNEDWNDMESGWVFELTDDAQHDIATAFTFPAGGDATSGKMTLRASSAAASRPVLNGTGAGTVHVVAVSEISNVRIEGIEFTKTSSGTGRGVMIDASMDSMSISDCKFSGANFTNAFIADNNTGTTIVIEDSEFGPASALGNAINTNNGEWLIRNCSFHDLNATGINHFAGGSGVVVVQNSLFYDCVNAIDVSSMIDGAGQSTTHISGCIFFNNTNGIDANATTSAGAHIFVHDCVFSNNSAYGIDTSATSANAIFGGNNQFYDNTSGHWNNLPLLGDGSNPPLSGDATGDPQFTNTTDGAEDFTPASGSPLINSGTPIRANGSGSTVVQINKGAVPNVAGAGGGSGAPGNMSGGLQ